MSEPDLEKQPLLTAGPVLSGSHANGLKQPAYDPNVWFTSFYMNSYRERSVRLPCHIDKDIGSTGSHGATAHGV